MSPLLIVIGIIIVLPALYIMSKYNGMVALRNKRNQSFSDIDVQLKQRFDLIPQLIEVVKGYMKHEASTLENVTKARTSFLNAGSTDDKIAADNMLSGALKSIFAVSENYPDLKANQNFLQLQSEMSDIENKLAAARRFFNNATTEFNTYIQMFPANIIAKNMGFSELELFKTDESRSELNKVPTVKF
jgi:LemA protein